MGIGRNPAAIVKDSDPIALRQMQLDAVGVASNRLVHRIVENL